MQDTQVTQNKEQTQNLNDEKEKFIQDRASREQNLTIDFAIALLQKEYLKKLIDVDIKSIKADAKSEGILIKNVQNALKNLKRSLKENGQNELDEEDFLFEVFSNNTEIISIINDIQSE